MIATLIVLLASTLAAIYNYLLRKNSESPEKAQNFVFYVLVFSLFFSLFFESAFLSSWLIGGLAVLSGILVSLIFYSLPKAFAHGPSGFAIAIFQSSCILPPLFMSLIFGCACGFAYTFFHFFGALLVVFGLLFSALKGPKQAINKQWMGYTAMAFGCQAIILTIYQYKALIVKPNLPPHPLIVEATADWYFPVMFITAILMTFFLMKGKILFQKRIIVQGLAGGFFNTINTLLLILGLVASTPLVAPLLVPINSIATIILCNLWSRLFFQEKIYWLGSSIALAGVLLSFVEL